MNEEDLYAADQEERYFHRFNRWAKQDDDDSQEGHRAPRGPFSPVYFDAIWEGRR